MDAGGVVAMVASESQRVGHVMSGQMQDKTIQTPILSLIGRYRISVGISVSGRLKAIAVSSAVIEMPLQDFFV